MARAIPEVPFGIRKFHKSFARWRRSRTSRSPIRESLWRSATEPARRSFLTQPRDGLEVRIGIGFSFLLRKPSIPRGSLALVFERS